MRKGLFCLCLTIFFASIHGGPDNNLYDRNKREANCDTTGCYPRRPPYTMPKGYAASQEEPEDADEEEIAEIEPGILDQEIEAGDSQRLIF